MTGTVKKKMTLIMFMLFRTSACEVTDDSKDARIDDRKIYQTVSQK